MRALPLALALLVLLPGCATPEGAPATDAAQADPAAAADPQPPAGPVTLARLEAAVDALLDEQGESVPA